MSYGILRSLVQATFTSGRNSNHICMITICGLIVTVQCACDSVRIAVLLNAARTTDETFGDELARSVLHVWQTDRLVEHLGPGVAVVQLDEGTKPVDGQHPLCEFCDSGTAVKRWITKEGPVLAQIRHSSGLDLNVLFSAFAVQRTASGTLRLTSETNTKTICYRRWWTP